ncbi:hypothetical protein ACG83_03405 [Frankia sp. R43]|uniref:hypothetical protein n=1 Tax=Frankia sp. R43 TaxID=269536 RepID=UPI0006CA3EF5|nr:hypothetical protein [Frankia sp. R43]KPM56900.1 hypothetical protein ACG83_03405 [Frankia sp. R43]
MNQSIERESAGITRGPARRRHRLLRGMATAALATTMGVSLAGTALADTPQRAALGEGRPTKHACITADGTNLNEFFHIRQQIIGPPTCRTAVAGEPWVRIGPGWVTAASAATAVYPADYTPTKPNPIDDFNSKFLRARFVVDIGTPQEKSFGFGRKALRTGFFTEDGLPFSQPVSPPLRPLRVGQHTSTVFLTLRARHCDGLGTVPDENCLPAGEFAYTGNTPFEVVPRPVH